MGSSYFGEPNLGNERTAGTSRKSKKGNSDKPKQPQRGLGVAQLEKIRLHSQMGCHYLPPPHNPYSPNLSQEDMRLQTAYSSSSSFSYSTPSSSSYGSPGHQSVVADMRLQTAYSSSSSFSYSTPSSSSYGFPGHQSVVMGLSDYERANIKYGDSQPATITRWPPGNSFLDTEQFTRPSMTRQLLDLQVEESRGKRRGKDHGTDSIGSSSQNSESSGDQELDLELRLSL